MLQSDNSHTSFRSRHGAILSESAVAIAERIRGEFREMPGLTLTMAQAGRLWSLDASTCAEVLQQLCDTGYLCRRSDGTFGRSSDLAAHSMRLAKTTIHYLDVK